jgi:hypothetical protein
VAAPDWHTCPNVHSHSQAGCALDVPSADVPSSRIWVLAGVKAPEPSS